MAFISLLEKVRATENGLEVDKDCHLNFGAVVLIDDDVSYNQPEMIRFIYVIDEWANLDYWQCENGLQAEMRWGEWYVWQNGICKRVVSKYRLVITIKIPAPKTRLPVRWERGRWEKLTAKKGWIPA